MSAKIRLKHSSTVNKAPLPGDLIEGELALNINAASPAAYLKDSAGVVRKLSGIATSPTAPASPTAGMAWLDTVVPAKPVFKVYDGTTWQATGTPLTFGAAKSVYRTNALANDAEWGFVQWNEIQGLTQSDNAFGKRTVANTPPPAGSGADGDIWYQV